MDFNLRIEEIVKKSTELYFREYQKNQLRNQCDQMVQTEQDDRIITFINKNVDSISTSKSQFLNVDKFS